MTTTPSTLTVPEEKVQPVLPANEGLELITAIREYGSSVEYSLLARQMTFTMGSSRRCDIAIPSEYVSSLHCLLVRRGQRLRVTDQSSRNKTYFRGREESTFDVGPGDTFKLASSTFLAVNDHMRQVRPLFAEVLGHDRHQAIDDVLIAAVHDGPLMVVGEKGSGQDRLVKAFHEISHRRRHALAEMPFVPPVQEKQIEIVTRARHGSLVVTAKGVPIDESFLDMVLAPERHIRLVVLTFSAEAGVLSLKPDALMGMTKVEIPPLRERVDELEALVDRFFLENRMSLCFSDLTTENQDALRAHSWPENLDELRESVDWIAGITREGSIRKAAAVLNVARSSLQYWRARLELRIPLTLNHAWSDTDTPECDD